MKEIGVFYRVFFNPPRPGGSGRIYNMRIPDSADAETYPVVEEARSKLEQRHPDARTLTILFVCRDGPIIPINPKPESDQTIWRAEYRVREDQTWGPKKPIEITTYNDFDPRQIQGTFRALIRQHYRERDLKDNEIEISPAHGEPYYV